MVNKGEIIVARDTDLEDMYVCEVLVGDEETKRTLLCRVISMVNYPIQHAVYDGSVASENPPLLPGTVARLQFVHREIVSGGLQSWEASCKKCLEAYTQRRAQLYEEGRRTAPALRRFAMPDAKELEILARHARGEYHGRRVVCDR